VAAASAKATKNSRTAGSSAASNRTLSEWLVIGPTRRPRFGVPNVPSGVGAVPTCASNVSAEA
jgi:hypothetical protein